MELRFLFSLHSVLNEQVESLLISHYFVVVTAHFPTLLRYITRSVLELEYSLSLVLLTRELRTPYRHQCLMMFNVPYNDQCSICI
jgi:hypothetical protein